MAYFECVIGGGGTSLTIQITTSSTVLYGQTITISKGGSTVGTTAFDNTGNAEYTVRESGTYTVSVTMSGVTFSDTVEVTDTFDAQIEATPDGSTVTPVNDIQIWLHCGNVWNKNYTTLSEVLADTTTLLALISDNNAVDYMVRSHDWCDDICADATAMTYIGANNYAADTLLADDNPGLVPTMTSNTTPSGVVSASSVHSGTSYYPYFAFDGNTSTQWDSSGTGAGEWIKYEFPSAVKASKLHIVFGHEGTSQVYQDVELQGSNDDSTWTPLSDFQQLHGVVDTHDVTFVNDTAYKYYKVLKVTSPSGVVWAIKEVQFYAKDGSWLESICNSAYFESVLNVKVPTMTSNTTPSGQCIGSGETATYYKSFDGDNSTNFYIRNNTGYSDYVGYTFTAAVKVFKVGVIVGAVVLYIEGLNGASWESIGEIKGAGSALVYTQTSPNGSYSKYRVRLKTPYGSTGTMPIYTLQFYGRAAS